MSGSGALSARRSRGHSSLDERAALVALLRTRPSGMSWQDLTALIRQRDNVEDLFTELGPAELFASPEQVTNREEAIADVKQWESEGLEFITILDIRYPASVREIHQSPPFLFARGKLLPHDPAVSVVGSRKASARGLAMATRISEMLVDMGLSVIAGLALGIDTAAHTAALEAGGRTVALIGTGIRRQYPIANRNLHSRIAAHGLLLSQFWPDAPPQKHTFLMRNATMSGYGLATVVVEAGEHSGARAQARMAVEHGRPVILTDLVVNSTDWGKALVGRPGVSVAASIEDVRSAIVEIRRATKRIDDALDALLAV